MRPVWLLEAGVYGAEADPLLSVIRSQGMTALVVPHQAIRKDSGLDIDGTSLGDSDCVLGYGTFPFARQIQLYKRWIPGAWCDSTNLDCSCYFAYFGRFLLNQAYAILPGVEAIRQADWLFKVFGRDDAVFARPTGCHKVFTGRCISKDDFAAALSPTRYDPTTLVVVAAPKEIDREWRLVVAKDRVIAGSQYALGGVKSIAPGCPEEVKAFAQGMLDQVRWRPDPMFMLDVCESEGRLWLVELNGFSCSWLYQCDLAAVVGEAARLVEKAWVGAAK
jgi:ATP-grasp domain, R2K clade family 3